MMMKVIFEMLNTYMEMVIYTRSEAQLYSVNRDAKSATVKM